MKKTLILFQLAYCVVQFLEKDAALTEEVCKNTLKIFCIGCSILILLTKQVFIVVVIWPALQVMGGLETFYFKFEVHWGLETFNLKYDNNIRHGGGNQLVSYAL